MQGLGDDSDRWEPSKIGDGLPPTIAIAAGGNFSMFLTRNGIVYTCGENDVGQLGYVARDGRNIPQLVERFGSVYKISAGAKHCMALTEAGEVFTWVL